MLINFFLTYFFFLKRLWENDGGSEEKDVFMFEGRPHSLIHSLTQKVFDVSKLIFVCTFFDFLF